MRRFLTLVPAVMLVFTLAPAHATVTPGWKTAASMAYTRSFFGVARGGDGRLYAVGGYSVNPEYPPVAQVEAYDPSSDMWTTVGAMPNSRAELSVARGGDGRVYAIGGWDGSATTNEVDAYDTSTGTWTTVTPMPYAVADAAAATSNGKIYVFGGFNGEGHPYIRGTVQIYSPGTDSWTLGQPTPAISRYAATAVTAPDGNIYVIGGYRKGFKPGITGMVKMYSPSTDSWTSRAAMPTARWFLGGALGKDGKIYAIGGSQSTAPEDQALATVETYDPSTNSWATAPSLQVGRAALGAAPLGGRVYVVGGLTGTSSTTAVEYLATGS